MLSSLIYALFNFFSDKIYPTRDLWIIGEGFLRASFGALQDLKSEAKTSNRTLPYLYDFFRITPFFQKSASTPEGTLHKLHNSIIEGLNKETYLPHYIIFIPDRDIILQADFFHPGIGFVLQEQID